MPLYLAPSCERVLVIVDKKPSSKSFYVRGKIKSPDELCDAIDLMMKSANEIFGKSAMDAVFIQDEDELDNQGDKK